jgi:hypothetical protein
MIRAGAQAGDRAGPHPNSSSRYGVSEACAAEEPLAPETRPPAHGQSPADDVRCDAYPATAQAGKCSKREPPGSSIVSRVISSPKIRGENAAYRKLIRAKE